MSQLKSLIITLTLLLSTCMVLGVVTYVPEREVRATFSQILFVFQVMALAVIVTVGLAVALGTVGVLAWFSWIGFWAAVSYLSRARFKARVRNAIALKKEREASVVITVAKPGAPAWITKVVGSGLNVITEPLHLEAASAELAGRWNTFQALQSISKRSAQALPEPLPQVAAPLPDQVDLSHYVTDQSATLRSIFLGVGRFPDGQVKPVRAPLSRLVHIAVAGSSGFGKSFFEQSLAYQVINAREGAKVALLDAQGVTFTPWADSDRLLFPLASEPETIRLVLAELVKIMVQRQTLFSQWRGVDTLEKYNQVAPEKLPAIPILFDEFGLVANDKQISNSTEDLSKGGRKFGMFIIAGAQTWYSDRIASSLKANLSTAVQFYARSKSQSRVLLEDSIAASITRPGQAFCRLPGQTGLVEIQAPDVSTLIDVEPAPMEQRGRVIEPEPEEDKDDLFVRLVEDGKSRDEASREAYGKNYAGTTHVNRCRRLLGEI